MRKTITAALAASLLVGSLALPAAADYVSLVDAEEQTLEFVLGDAPKTVTLRWNTENTGTYLEGTDDEYVDTKSGCNIASGPTSTGEAEDPQVTLVPAYEPSGVATATEVVFDACETDDDDYATAQVTITATAVGSTTVSFVIDDERSKYRSGIDLSRASIVVTVVAPQEVDGRDAPAIANQFLLERGDGKKKGNEDCTQLGTGKNGANWHGRLISTVAAEFPEGSSFTAAQVEAFVENACTSGF